MRQEALDYLKTQRVGILAVEMLDGSPHAATVHYAHTEDPLVFYFETCRDYRKAEPILNNESVRASFVIGNDESAPKTLQLDGIVKLLKPEEMQVYHEIYLGKFPEKIEKSKNPDLIFFKFTPTWWRFTDWTLPDGKKIWSSK